ncbi:flagellar FlbD family protein [Tersicoccus sp. Bi-70]|uniref:flagellar FlbD family protein n=1 Tax=Tersicoccus sp. Bi-70 TaxID=1897634 RepID=UPI00097639BE|nr:flagellar FlbD family protein [Tersicoccus sp. Bi-70]OMH30568.1 hypothetical protein BGP79_11370 [Tersicoccus sp. Bi-70]
MIVVTRLNGTRFAVNPDLIERVHASPDTYLVMVDGTTYVVSESMDTVIDLIARYRARVVATARSLSDESIPRLSVVPDPGPRESFGSGLVTELTTAAVPTVLHPAP